MSGWDELLRQGREQLEWEEKMRAAFNASRATGESSAGREASKKDTAMSESYPVESNPALVKAYALIDRYIEALKWCSGSADFGHGGQAREGWLKLCEPLLPDRAGDLAAFREETMSTADRGGVRMTTPALRAAALAMARIYSDDGRAERRAEMIEGPVRVAVVAWLRARGGELDAEGRIIARDLYLLDAHELDPPAGPIGEDQDD